MSRWTDEEAADDLNGILRIDARMSLADDLLIVADHYSMSESVELRVPFLDLRMFDLIERMPSRYKVSLLGERKWLYRKAAATMLPPDIARELCGFRARIGRKRGFSTPLNSWFSAGNGPLSSTDDWRRPLYELGVLSTSSLDSILSRPPNGDEARQRSLLFSLATWAQAVTS